MGELAAHELKLESLPRYTVVPTGVGFCLLMKQLVLNMIGTFDPAYGRGYNEENDWAMRAQTLGFTILRANRALVYHLGTASFGGEREELDRTNTSTLLNRYPYFLDEVSAFSKRAEARIAASYVRRRLGATSVCISARHLDSTNVHGTEVYALQLAKNLKEHAGLEVVGLAKTAEQERLLAEIGIESRTGGHSEREQIFHHPAQIFHPQDLRLFLSAPGHSVITFHDLIAWRTPSAHRSIDDFEQYVAMSFAALHSAQAVIAISNHNRDEIIREFHLPPERVHTVYWGVDPSLFEARGDGDERSRLEALGLRKPYFLYVGTDYAHKNLKLLLNAYAIFRHRFHDGTKASPELVLIGAPSYSVGSIYDRDEPWPPGVRYLGAVDAADLRAFYRAALAFVFPSACEGFGLPVLEAMAAGIPVVCSSLTSLPEVAGDAALYIKDFSPEEIARLMVKVATSADVRRSLVREGRSRVKKFTWREAARKTAEVYQNAIEHPAEITLFQRSMFGNLLRVPMARLETELKAETEFGPFWFPGLIDKLRRAVYPE
jgi:glycosyltransferase involved in cell wall biosynthesis